MVIVAFPPGEKYAVNYTTLDQYDYGQILRIQGLKLPKTVEVHFSTQETGGTSITRVGVTKDGVTDVLIPDSVLENGDTTQNYSIFAFVYITDATSGKTEYRARLEVKARPKPEVPGGSDNPDVFRDAVLAVRESAEKAEEAQRQADEDAKKTTEDRKAVEHAVESVKDITEQVARVEELSRNAQEAATQTQNAAQGIITDREQINTNKEGVAQLKEDLSELSEEIDDLKENGTGSGVTWGDVEDGEKFGVIGTESEEPDEPIVPDEPDIPSTSHVTDNLAVYYDFTQYEDNYTGEVEDLSGNGIVPDIKNLEYSYSGRGGFLGNKLMLGNTDYLNSSSNEVRLGFNTEAVKNYPFTVEFYAHLRNTYERTLADGVLGYPNSSLPGQWNMIAFGNAYKTVDDTTESLNGIQGRITENAVYIWGSGNNPNSITAPIELVIDGFNNSNIGEEYHHFVFCFESNAQQVYMDGQLVMSTTNSSCALTSTGYMLMFPSLLQADLKMLRVYSDILSEYEVYTNYQSVIGGTYAVSVANETTGETTEDITRKAIKELDKFPVTMARAVYMNNSNTTVEDEIKALKKGSTGGNSGSVVLNAVIDETGKVSFKNSVGVTVFTLDLAQMNVGALQLPRIYLNGDTTNMGKDSPVPMKFKYVDADTLVEAYTEIEWQGNSSLANPIKNYGFDLYSDEALEESLDTSFLPHMETDSYHLKANYVDPSNVKNIAGARLFKYICDTVGLTFPNGGRCVIDGIPVEVYVNNKFNGVYTLNYKQSKSLFGMGDGTAEFIYRCEDGTGWGLFTGDSFPTKEEFDLIWEARYPKPKNLTHHNEIQRMLKWVNDATDDAFKTNYASYLNIDSVIAYKICGDIMGFRDNGAKNLTVCSWNGQTWYTIPYDMDMGMVDENATGMMEYGSKLWTKLNTNFPDEKKAMYKTLRDSGMNADTVFGLYSDILYSIGMNGYVADKKVKYIPYPTQNSVADFVEFDDYINYHKEFIQKRIELMDEVYGYTVS